MIDKLQLLRDHISDYEDDGVATGQLADTLSLIADIFEGHFQRHDDEIAALPPEPCPQCHGSGRSAPRAGQCAQPCEECEPSPEACGGWTGVAPYAEPPDDKLDEEPEEEEMTSEEEEAALAKLPGWRRILEHNAHLFAKAERLEAQVAGAKNILDRWNVGPGGQDRAALDALIDLLKPETAYPEEEEPSPEAQEGLSGESEDLLALRARLDRAQAAVRGYVVEPLKPEYARMKRTGSILAAGDALCMAADRVQAKADQTDVDVVALRAVMDDWDAITQTEEE